MKIKIAIIGSGRMGLRHALAYQKIKNVEVIGFSDIDQKKAKLLSEQFHNNHFKLEKVFENKNIDAIDICTPNVLHAQHSISAMKSGKHVIVEKPMALNLQDCEKMISISKKYKVNLMVGHTYRYYPSTKMAKKIIDSETIGKIKMIMGYGIDPGQINNQGQTPSWTFDHNMGGGVFFDAIHGIDKLRYWLDSEVKSVYVPIMDKIFPGNTEQLGIFNLIFRNGVVATSMALAPSWGIRDTGDKIIGSKGALYVTYGEEVKVGKKKWKNFNFKHKAKPASFEHNLDGFVTQLNEFTNSIKENRKPVVDGEEGKKNLRVVLALYESFKKKKVIKL